jgi:hypothetical protein
MATTKIWPIRDNLARVIEYAENHLKTANPKYYTEQEFKDLRNVLDYASDDGKTAQRFYVTGVNCIAEIAYEQMITTKERFGKKGGNLAYHAYQSFAPDEATPELCHQIGVTLAKRIWGDYEVLVTTHLNTHCVHNHLVINSVSRIDGKKLNNNYAMYFNKLRAESDRLCRECDLSVIEEPGKSAKSRRQRQAEQRGESTLYNVIRSDIDEAIRRSLTGKQFYAALRNWGYVINDGPNRKYATIRPPGMQKRIRFKTLGEIQHRGKEKSGIISSMANMSLCCLPGCTFCFLSLCCSCGKSKVSTVCQIIRNSILRRNCGHPSGRWNGTLTRRACYADISLKLSRR